ncbi:MAG: hypothetical protein OHK0023_16540 [Anaerolineae bacterium]
MSDQSVSSTSSADTTPSGTLLSLLTNHLDAYGLTFIIGALCLVIHDALKAESLFLLVGMAMLAWLAFAFNDYCDAPYDAHDSKKRSRNFFTQRGRGWYLLVGAILTAGIALAAFGQYGWRGIGALVVSLLVLWAYSAPPLRLKSRPVLDLFTHALFVQTAPYFITLFLIGASWLALDYLMLTIFFLSSLAAQLEQQARDYEVDSATDTNFTTVFGRRVSVVLLRAATITIVATAALGAASGIIPPALHPFGLIAAPIFLHRLLRRITEPRSEVLVMVSVVLAIIYAGYVLVYGVV